MAINGEQREVTSPDELPDGNVVISLKDEPDDDSGGDDGMDDDGAPPAAGKEAQARRAAGLGGKQKPGGEGRRDRRASWAREQQLNTELSATKAQVTQLEARFQRELAEIRQQHQAGQSQQRGAGQSAPSPDEQQLKLLQGAVASELQAMRNHDPKGPAYDLTRYHEIQRNIRKIENRLDVEEHLKSKGIDVNAKPQPQQRQESAEEIAQRVEWTNRRNIVVGESPWLKEQGPQGDRYREAMVNQIKALVSQGRPDGLDTDREAAAIVERAFGLTPRRQSVDPARARRYESVSDDNRGAPYGREPTEISIPADQLEGSGLSMERIRAAVRRR